jgi:hypothetical protein
MVFLSSSVQATPVVINGNANGLWSPTHPHVTGGNDKPKSPVLYTEPEPEPAPVVAVDPEPAPEQPKVCPTIQSAPHLCPPG